MAYPPFLPSAATTKLMGLRHLLLIADTHSARPTDLPQVGYQLRRDLGMTACGVESRRTNIHRHLVIYSWECVVYRIPFQLRLRRGRAARETAGSSHLSRLYPRGLCPGHAVNQHVPRRQEYEERRSIRTTSTKKTDGPRGILGS